MLFLFPSFPMTVTHFPFESHAKPHDPLVMLFSMMFCFLMISMRRQIMSRPKEQISVTV